MHIHYIRNPSPSNSTWRVFTWDQGSIEINPEEDPNACVYCTYYISVTTLWYQASYTITATTQSGENNAVVLIDGQPFSDTIYATTPRLYLFYINQLESTPSDIAINLGFFLKKRK